MESLKSPVALLHDRGDLYVPAQESLRFFDRLGGEPRAQMAVLDVIQHAQLSAPDLSPPVLLGSFIPGMWTLWQFTDNALRPDFSRRQPAPRRRSATSAGALKAQWDARRAHAGGDYEGASHARTSGRRDGAGDGACAG